MAYTYDQLQKATLADLQADPNLAKTLVGLYGEVSGGPAAMLNYWNSGYRNFEQDKASALGANLGGSYNEIYRNLDRYNSWNMGDTTARALEEQKLGQAGLQEKATYFQNLGIDPMSIPTYKSLYEGLYGSTTPQQYAQQQQAGQGVMDVYDQQQAQDKQTPEMPKPGQAPAVQPGQPAPQGNQVAETGTPGAEQGQVQATATPSFEETLRQVYLTRPDLQAVYNIDGSKKDPNNPSPATLKDWGTSFGIQESPDLKKAYESGGSTQLTTAGGQTVSSGATAVAEGAVTTAPAPSPEIEKGFEQIYVDAYTKLGLGTLKTQIDDYNKQIRDLKDVMAEEIQDINDNPWMSEATRVDRINGINTKYDTKLTNLQNFLVLEQALYEDGIEQARFLTTGIYEQSEARRTEAQARLDKQMEANSAIVEEYNVTTQYYNKAGTFRRSSDGKGYSLPEDFFRDAGVSSFQEAYARGLVTDIDPTKKADRAAVMDLANEYPDAGIDRNNDTWDQATAKLTRSRKWNKENYIAPSGNEPDLADRLSNMDFRVKQIIAANPNEWGKAATQIDREFGAGTATLYDPWLKAVYQQGVNPGSLGSLQSTGGSTVSNTYQAELGKQAQEAIAALRKTASEGVTGRNAAFYESVPDWLKWTIPPEYNNFKANLEWLKANVFANSLAQMREASKTGGAVGNVSDKEGDRLSSLLGGLSETQSYDQFQDSLNQIEQTIQSWQNEVQQYGYMPDTGGTGGVMTDEQAYAEYLKIIGGGQ